MEQNRKFRDKTITYGHLIFDKDAKIYSEEKTISLKSDARKLFNHMQKNEIRTLSNTIHKSKLKMD